MDLAQLLLGFHPNGWLLMVSRTDVLILLVQGPAVTSSTLSNVNTIVDTISKAVTAIAVIIGGLWAYFKFVRGRTYRPRLEVDTEGKWWLMNEKWLLQARVIVKNVGASKVELPQRGTGLKVSVPADDQPPPPARTVWAKKKVFVILKDHEWIESGETIFDVLLLDLGVPGTCPALLEARLVSHRQTGNVVFTAREIVPASAPLNEVKRDEGIDANDRHGPNSVLAQESPEAPRAESRRRGRDRPMGER